MSKTTPSSKGFTLVELAIVLMIIGLLIGGILKGQQLIHNTRLTTIIRQLNSFKAADVTFRDSYGAQAGDMGNATTRLPNCNAGTNCVNGDGNGIIGGITNNAWGPTPGFATENTQYWKHLALANLISGIDSSAPASAWGESHPSSPVGGGYTILRVNATNTSDPFTTLGGTIIRLHNYLTGAYAEVDDNVTNPADVFYIDQKMDDGKPQGGFLRAGDGWSGDGPCENYDMSFTGKYCTLYFVLEK